VHYCGIVTHVMVTCLLMGSPSCPGFGALRRSPSRIERVEPEVKKSSASSRLPQWLFFALLS
jgi:hypothetical protein